MGIHAMSNGGNKFATSEWLKLIGVIFAHAVLVFSALMFWANRIVTVETKVAAIEVDVTTGLSEVRTDIKEILKRTPKP